MLEYFLATILSSFVDVKMMGSPVYKHRVAAMHRLHGRGNLAALAIELNKENIDPEIKIRCWWLKTQQTFIGMNSVPSYFWMSGGLDPQFAWCTCTNCELMRSICGSIIWNVHFVGFRPINSPLRQEVIRFYYKHTGSDYDMMREFCQKYLNNWFPRSLLRAIIVPLKKYEDEIRRKYESNHSRFFGWRMPAA